MSCPTGPAGSPLAGSWAGTEPALTAFSILPLALLPLLLLLLLPPLTATLFAAASVSEGIAVVALVDVWPDAGD